MTAARLAPALLALGLCGGLAACGGSGSKRLQGTWKGQHAEGVAASASASANAFAAGTTLVFKGDAVTVTTPRDTQAGHYKVAIEDKNSVFITADKDGQGDPQKFTFQDDRTMRWAVTSGATIVFARQ